MPAFVTGGSGFIGRTLIGMLRERGETVRALARSDSAVATVTGAGATAVRGELRSDETLHAGMAGCDVVFHVAGHVATWGNAADIHRTNVLGTEHVLAAARAACVPRLVHVSTEAVLIDGHPIRSADERVPRPARPLGPYARSKGLAEARVLAANAPGFATIVVRPRLVWGAGDTSVLPLFVESVRSGRFRWIEHGRYPTSTCHVLNVCEGLLLAAARGRAGEIYFVTDGPPVEFRAFLTALLRSQGLDPGTRSMPRAAARAAAGAAEIVWRVLRLRGAPPIDRAAVATVGQEVTVNDAKARRELGYTSAVSRDAGLAALGAAPPPAARASPDSVLRA
jgi:nucleoside-diphosphate-sugar epimerase